MNDAEAPPRHQHSSMRQQRWQQGAVIGWHPVLALALSIALTTLATWGSWEAIAQRDRARFERWVETAVTALNDRRGRFLTVLRAAAGVMAIKPDLTPDEFAEWVRAVGPDLRLEGIRGVGFMRRVPRPERFGDGAGTPGVWPPGEREEYTPVELIQPMTPANAQAIGFDPASSPDRWEAIRRARDTGLPASTGLLLLLAEPGEPPAPGFVTFVPVYARPARSVEERRAALVGYVFGGSRADRYFYGTLQNGTSVLRIRVYAAAGPDPAALLFDSHPPGPGVRVEGGGAGEGAPDAESAGGRESHGDDPPPRFTAVTSFDAEGSPRTLVISTRPPFDATSGRGLVWVVLATGAALSLATFGVSLAQHRARARAAAGEERLRASQAQLAQSEQRLRLILDSALEYAIFTLDLDGKVTLWNPGAERIFGYAAAEVLGTDASVLYTPEDREHARARVEMRTAAERGKAKNDRWHLRKGGERFYCNGLVMPLRGPRGEPAGYLKILRDMTQEREAERAIAVSEEEFRAIFERSGVAQTQTDPATGRFTRVNRRFCELVGYTEEELLGLSISAVTHPDDRPLEDEHLERVRSGDLGEYSLEKRYLRRDGAVVWASVTRTPVRDPEGRVLRVASVVQDVTARRRAEADLLRLHEELERRVEERTTALRRANEELEAYAYMISHDLRAPLRGMHGFARALLKYYGERLDDTGRDYASRIVAAADRMDRLIRDLLDYSRLARADLGLRVVEAQRAVSDAIAQLEPAVRESGAEIAVDCPMPIVVGHRTTLTQVLTNLIGNALKFVGPGVKPRVRITCERDGGTARIVVQDNGIGIPPEHHQRIFTVFERLHGGEAYDGTGIGLAIVKRGVERMNGRVGVESVLGIGSRFWIELPIAEGGGEGP